MDGPREYKNKCSQIEKDKYHMISLIVESESNTNESIYKSETDSQTQETIFWLPKGEDTGAGRSTSRLYIVYLTYMQSTSCEMPGWRITSWNEDFWEKYKQSRYTDDTTLMAESEEELKSLLMTVKEESEKLA